MHKWSYDVRQKVWVSKTLFNWSESLKVVSEQSVDNEVKQFKLSWCTILLSGYGALSNLMSYLQNGDHPFPWHW